MEKALLDAYQIRDCGLNVESAVLVGWSELDEPVYEIDAPTESRYEECGYWDGWGIYREILVSGSQP